MAIRFTCSVESCVFAILVMVTCFTMSVFTAVSCGCCVLFLTLLSCIECGSDPTLLNFASSSDLAVPRCRRACLGGAFLLSFTFSFASSSSARDLQHRTCLRLRCCLSLCSGLLEVGLQYVLDLAASHLLGHLYLSWHLCCNSTTLLRATLISS